MDDLCQCCLSNKNLRSLDKPYLHHGEVENYKQMLIKCYNTELTFSNGKICSDCVRQLRAALRFRQCIEAAKRYLTTKSEIPSSINHVYQDKNKRIPPLHYDEKEDNEDLTETDDCLFDHHDNLLSDENIDELETVPINHRKTDNRTVPYILQNTDRKCNICDKVFSFFSELSNHMPEHFPNHICDVCGKICATRKSLIIHTKIHRNDRHNCSICPKSFKNKSNLNAHIKVQHKGDKILFKCPLCADSFNTYNSRIKHLVEKHGKEDKSYKCQQCSNKYRLGSHLRAHVRRVHLQEKNHKCEICGSSFFTKKNLKNHSLKHSIELK